MADVEGTSVEFDAGAIAARLYDDVRHAEANVERIAREYDDLLADPETIQEDRDTTASLLEQARAALSTSQAAVARLEAGEYGRCVKCGAAIPPERLEVIPDATTCATCS